MPGGRPKKEIDLETAKKLALIQCTMPEIADFFDVSLSFLEKHKAFLRVYKKHIGEGRMSLRRKQWRAADEGNTTMLVWLGKQYLKQRENPDKLTKWTYNKTAPYDDQVSQIMEAASQGVRRLMWRPPLFLPFLLL